MTIRNDPRKRVKSGQNTNLLQSAIDRIKDEPTRSAIVAIVDYLMQQQSGGIVSDGPAFVRSLSTSLGGAFKVQMFDDEIRSRDNTNLTDITELIVPGVVFGAFGWVQYNASEIWEPLTIGTPGSNSNRAYLYTNGDQRKVRLRNNDTGHANKYRVVVFYRDDAL